jgi:hypothetical protein
MTPPPFRIMMKMPIRALALFALAASAAFSQSWDSLGGLKPGDPIVVLDSTGNVHKGPFRAYTADTIRIETRKGEQAIERTRVQQVQLRTRPRRLRNVLIGAGIGVALGVAVDHTVGTYLRNEAGEGSGTRAISYIAPIAIFSAIGAALPNYRTIYRAR